MDDKLKKYNKEYYEKNKEIIKSRSLQNKGKYKRDPEKVKESKKRYYQKNKEKILLKEKIDYIENKEKINRKNKEYRTRNSDSIKVSNKNYVFLNKEKVQDYHKDYYQKNKEKIKLKQLEKKEETRVKQNLYLKKKRLDDPLFKLKGNVRRIFYLTFKRNGYKKESRSYKILGISFEEFKLHLESKFQDWMTWENYGKYNGELNYGWDIDHITPISNAKTEEEVYNLNHYSNLQPLCSKINRDIKIDKLFFSI